jgi:hypothetical protein
MLSKGDDLRSMNQLKYVCRQLHQETAGIEIKFNSITFDSPQPGTSIRQFFRSVQGCSPARLTWLKRAVLEEKGAREEKDHYAWVQKHLQNIVSLLGFCDANPETTVALQIP